MQHEIAKECLRIYVACVAAIVQPPGNSSIWFSQQLKPVETVTYGILPRLFPSMQTLTQPQQQFYSHPPKTNMQRHMLPGRAHPASSSSQRSKQWRRNTASTTVSSRNSCACGRVSANHWLLLRQARGEKLGQPRAMAGCRRHSLISCARGPGFRNVGSP